MVARSSSALLTILAVLPLVGCDGTAECATGANGDGSYTLAVDGLCLDRVTVAHRVDGAWQASGTELAWQATLEGGLHVVVSAPAPAEALEVAISGLDADEMLQQGYQSWGFSGTVSIPLMVVLDDDGRPRID